MRAVLHPPVLDSSVQAPLSLVDPCSMLALFDQCVDTHILHVTRMLCLLCCAALCCVLLQGPAAAWQREPGAWWYRRDVPVGGQQGSHQGALLSDLAAVSGTGAVTRVGPGLGSLLGFLLLPRRHERYRSWCSMDRTRTHMGVANPLWLC